MITSPLLANSLLVDLLNKGHVITNAVSVMFFLVQIFETSSNFSVFDRDRFGGLLQVPLQLLRIPYLGDECYRSSHKACCPLPITR